MATCFFSCAKTTRIIVIQGVRLSPPPTPEAALRRTGKSQPYTLSVLHLVLPTLPSRLALLLHSFVSTVDFPRREPTELSTVYLVGQSHATGACEHQEKRHSRYTWSKFLLLYRSTELKRVPTSYPSTSSFASAAGSAARSCVSRTRSARAVAYGPLLSLHDPPEGRKNIVPFGPILKASERRI